MRDEPGFDFPDWWGTVFEWCTYVVVGGWFVAAIPYGLGNQRLVMMIGIIMGIAFIVAVTVHHSNEDPLSLRHPTLALAEKARGVVAAASAAT